MGATDEGGEVEAPEEVQPLKELRTPDLPTPAEMAETTATSTIETGVSMALKDLRENGLTNNLQVSGSYH